MARNTGRPVRVVSLSFPVGTGRERVAAVVDAEGARGCDLIALPETWMGQADRDPEELAGPTVTLMSELARRHATYIVCPIDRIEGTIDRIQGTRRLNTAVLIDRRGKIAGSYDKVFPYWSEFDVTPAVSVGTTVPVFDTDCGRIGVTTCFDVNFPEVWQRLAEQEAELVIWPSAYSAGTSLQAHALNHHFYIVTSTQTCDCLVYDITGRQLLYEKDCRVQRVADHPGSGSRHLPQQLQPRQARPPAGRARRRRRTGTLDGARKLVRAQGAPARRERTPAGSCLWIGGAA